MANKLLPSSMDRVWSTCSRCSKKLYARHIDVTLDNSFVCHCDITNGIDEHYLDEIDTEAKAYMLGRLSQAVVIDRIVLTQVISDVWPGIRKSEITSSGAVSIGQSVYLNTVTYGQLTVSGNITGTVNGRSNTRQPPPAIDLELSDLAVKSIEIRVRQMWATGVFPPSFSVALKLAFIRGLWESTSWPTFDTLYHGFMSGDTTTQLTRLTPLLPTAVPWFVIYLGEPSQDWCFAIQHALRVPMEGALSSHQELVWTGTVNVLDVLGKLYSNASHYNPVAQAKFTAMCGAKQHSSMVYPRLEVVRTLSEAVLPSKSRISDSGYDLTIVKQFKVLGPKTILYDTGIQITPPYGYYFDVVPRSSLSKTGHMLANNVGVIDQSYRGSILVAVIKVDETAPDLQLPFCGFQLIPREIRHFEVAEIKPHQAAVTERGGGGFGSTSGAGIQG